MTSQTGKQHPFLVIFLIPFLIPVASYSPLRASHSHSNDRSKRGKKERKFPKVLRDEDAHIYRIYLRTDRKPRPLRKASSPPTNVNPSNASLGRNTRKHYSPFILHSEWGNQDTHTHTPDNVFSLPGPITPHRLVLAQRQRLPADDNEIPSPLLLPVLNPLLPCAGTCMYVCNAQNANVHKSGVHSTRAFPHKAIRCARWEGRNTSPIFQRTDPPRSTPFVTPPLDSYLSS